MTPEIRSMLSTLKTSTSRVYFYRAGLFFFGVCDKCGRTLDVYRQLFMSYSITLSFFYRVNSKKRENNNVNKMQQHLVGTYNDEYERSLIIITKEYIDMFTLEIAYNFVLYAYLQYYKHF